MSPAHLNGFTSDGKSQLRRVLERAVAQRPVCHARCGGHAAGVVGFCQACLDLLPAQLLQPLVERPTVKSLLLAIDWVRGLRAEGAHE